MWERYNPRELRPLRLPEALADAMDLYSSMRGARKTEIFDSAILALMNIWEKDKNKVMTLLRENPPPVSKKSKRWCVRFTGERSFEWVCDLEREYAAVFSTNDFVKRALSWYLREMGFLKAIDVQPPFYQQIKKSYTATG